MLLDVFKSIANTTSKPLCQQQRQYNKALTVVCRAFELWYFFRKRKNFFFEALFHECHSHELRVIEKMLV